MTGTLFELYDAGEISTGQIITYEPDAADRCIICAESDPMRGWHNIRARISIVSNDHIEAIPVQKMHCPKCGTWIRRLIGRRFVSPDGEVKGESNSVPL